MKKKGFTLIEIIICLTLITLIGVGSFFGIKLIKKNIIIDELSKITDKILSAAEVYIETDKKTYDQIYNKKNAAVIPLKTLINEGLVDLSLTTLEDDDIENEYILSAFTSNPKTPEGCVEITNTASWTMSSSAPIYICANGTSGSGANLTITSNGSNFDRITTNNVYTFKGNGVDNFIKYKDNVYSIISIEKDDSLILASKYSFGNTFDGLTENINAYERIDGKPSGYSCSGDYYGINEGKYWYGFNSKAIREYEVVSGEALLATSDLEITMNDLSGDWPNTFLWNYLKIARSQNRNGTIMNYCLKYEQEDGKDVGYKIHLKSCLKISSRGTGTSTNPYILENYC